MRLFRRPTPGLAARRPVFLLCRSVGPAHPTTASNAPHALLTRATAMSSTQAGPAAIAPAAAAASPSPPPSSSPRKGGGPRQWELVEAAMFPSPRPLVDIGINLMDKSYAQDRLEVIARARHNNVRALIVTGTNLTTSELARNFCATAYPMPPSASNHAAGGPTQEPNGHGRNVSGATAHSTGSSAAAAAGVTDGTVRGSGTAAGLSAVPLYFTAGVHPHHAKTCDGSTIAHLRALASHPQCVAVGETGLDFNRNFSPPDVQEHWFEQQVILAKELKKPLFMHCRDAGAKFAEILRRHAPHPAPAVIHCFTGSAQELREFLDLGLYIGITGWVCDERAERGGAELASLLPSIPRDRLMIETDAPYLTPRTIKPSKARPGRNEPALLPHVLRTAAEALGVSEAELADSTTAVAVRVFGIHLASD